LTNQRRFGRPIRRAQAASRSLQQDQIAARIAPNHLRSAILAILKQEADIIIAFHHMICA
jgi:hypothetical protein